jgi:hypothetical protein
LEWICSVRFRGLISSLRTAHFPENSCNTLKKNYLLETREWGNVRKHSRIHYELDYMCVCVSLDLSKKLNQTLVAATRHSNFLGSLRRIRSERLPSLFSHLCLRESDTVR